MRLFFLLPGLLLAGPLAAQPTPAAPPHTVLVRGSAEQELEPEKLDLLLTYRFSDNVKAGERSQNQEEGLQQVLRQAGISSARLVLEELSASGYGGVSKVNNTTVALTKIYRLTLDNPLLANTLIPQLAQTGADNLRVVNLQSSKLAAAKAEVATQAIAAARQKAALAAKAAGGQLGGVVALVEVLPATEPLGGARAEAYKMSGAYYSMSEARQGNAEGQPTSLRKIKVTAAYDLVVELKP